MRRVASPRTLLLLALICAVAAGVEAAVWLGSGGGSGAETRAASTSARPTTSAARTGAGTYAFVRDTNRWGPTSVPFDLASRYQLDTVLFASNDANLDAAITAARAQRAPYGIWIPEGDGPSSPVAYARYVAMLERRYDPQALVVNIEARGKGAVGSAGWAWNERAARELAEATPSAQLGVAVLPNQTDFNYRAWLQHGARVFLPEAFGPDPRTQRFDPHAVVRTVVEAGVPPRMVQPLLTPGQVYDGPASYYPLDDLPVPAATTTTTTSP